MKTLKQNYAKNIDILKENLKRGMSYEMSKQVIEGQKNAFINNNLFNDDEKNYIQTMVEIVNKHFGITEIKASNLMKSIGVNVVNIK